MSFKRKIYNKGGKVTKHATLNFHNPTTPKPLVYKLSYDRNLVVNGGLLQVLQPN